MKREIWKKLEEWKGKKDRKPLILKGARQVGKTYILKAFGKESFPKFHYANFEKDKQLAKIFEKDLNPKRIIQELSFYLNTTIDIQNDFIIFDAGKTPQPGDICMCLLRKRYFLMRITKKTFDDHFLSYDGSQDYSFPKALSDQERDQRLHYEPLAYTEENKDVFLKLLDDEEISYFPLPEFFVTATALRLTRALSY